MNSGSKAIPAIHVPFKQEHMKALRASPVSFCSPALALQPFILCCCEFTAGATAMAPERRSDMKVLRVSPARFLAPASVSQVFIRSCCDALRRSEEHTSELQ